MSDRWEGGRQALLAAGAPGAVVRALATHSGAAGSESTVQYAAKAVSLLSATEAGREATLAAGIAAPLARALSTPCPRAAYYVLKAVGALGGAVTPFEHRRALLEAGLAPALLACLSRHGFGAQSSPDTAQACAGAGLRAIAALTAGFTAAREALCAAGAAVAVTASMRAHAGSPDCAASGCSALRGLADGTPEEASAVGAAGGLRQVVSAMETHPGDADVAAAGLRALADAAVLSYPAASAAGAQGVAEHALRLHAGNEEVSKQGRRVLSVFVNPGTPLISIFPGRGERPAYGGRGSPTGEKR